MSNPETAVILIPQSREKHLSFILQPFDPEKIRDGKPDLADVVRCVAARYAQNDDN